MNCHYQLMPAILPFTMVKEDIQNLIAFKRRKPWRVSFWHALWLNYMIDDLCWHYCPSENDL